MPLAVRVRLPAGMRVISALPAGKIAEGEWQADLTLLTDVEIRLVFGP